MQNIVLETKRIEPQASGAPQSLAKVASMADSSDVYTNIVLPGETKSRRNRQNANYSV